jgi:hypothetical protein
VVVPAALNFLPHTLRNEIPSLLVCVLYHHSWILPADAFSSARMPMPLRDTTIFLSILSPSKTWPLTLPPKLLSPSKQNPKKTRTQHTLTHTLALLLTQNLPLQLRLLLFQLLLLLLKKNNDNNNPKEKNHLLT